MSIRTLIICLLLLSVSVTAGHADSTIEYREKRGAILLEGFDQWAGLTYQYNQHSSGEAGSAYSQHKFEELYHFSTAGSVVSDRLLTFGLQGDLRFQQLQTSSEGEGSGNANGVRYGYNFAGNFFQKSLLPVTFSSSITFDTVATPFAPTYDIENDRHRIEMNYAKKAYSSKFVYERNGQTITNQNGSHTSKGNLFQFSGGVVHNENMQSSLMGAWTTQKGTGGVETITQEDYKSQFSNKIFWGAKRNYALTTDVNWEKSKFGDVPSDSFSVSEGLHAAPGEALWMDLFYRYDTSSTTSFAGVEQTNTANEVKGSLHHKLFRSLETTLAGRYENRKIFDGTQNLYSGKIRINYRKMLPAQSNLGVEATYGYGITDRNFTGSELDVSREHHTVLTVGETFSLNIPLGRLTRIVSFVNTLTQQDYALQPDLYYTVDYELGQITLRPVIPAGTELEISYIVFVDPSIKYSTTDTALSSTLSLLGGRYILNGMMLSTQQKILSGEQSSGIQDFKSYVLRAAAYYPANTLDIEYGYREAGPSEFQYVDAGWQFTPPLQHGIFRWTLRDRYTMYGQNSTSTQADENTLTAQASYNTILYQRFQVMLSVLGIDRRTGSDARDYLNFNASVTTWINQLYFTLTGQTSLQWYGTHTIQNNFVRLDMRRYF